MEPAQQARDRRLAITFVVNRLVRQWCKFKYDQNLQQFALRCGGQWDDEAISLVLDRVYSTDIRSVTSQRCFLSVDNTPASGFEECVARIKTNPRASILPPVIVRTKSGDWVLVVNQGNNMLQGFSQASSNDYVYVDKNTYESGCFVLDVHLQKSKLLCSCWSRTYTPKATKLFRSGSDIDVMFKQTELDAALLEQTDTYDAMLS